MKNLVRGGVILSLIGMFVMFIYAQARTENALSIAKNSQQQAKAEAKLETNIKPVQSALPEATPEKAETTAEASDPEDKKLVKKTASSSAAGRRSLGSFTATAYCLRGKTAMGHGVRRGIIAADPRVLKLGSRVLVGHGSYTGEYLVSDTGGKIKGKKIDIWVPSCAEARRFGRRTVTIHQ
jgi:3D (Asp-Asp-Asp) domain-containing protein